MDSALKTPLVTIMMTSYNRAELISEAIESVLKQTYENWELLILDDASTDNTKNVVESYINKDSRIIYLPAPHNLGITKNRNRGFSNARGLYIAVLDSDDYWTNPEKLEKQVEFLEEHQDYALVGTNVTVVNSSDNETRAEFKYETTDQKIRGRILLRNQFTHSSLLIRRSMLGERPYDETLPIWEDYEMILRLGKISKLANLPEIMTAYRKHSGNISKTAKRTGADTHLNIIKKYQHQYPNFTLALLKGHLRKGF